MVKSKTGREVRKGDWLYDTTGVYEVKHIDVGTGNLIILSEIVFPENDSDDSYTYGDDRWLTRKEVAKMDVF